MICLGIAAATVLRILFAYFAVQLLAVIGLTLAGGVLLLWVSWKMYREIRETPVNEHLATAEAGCCGSRTRIHRTSATQALTRIVLADVSMSLDNVLAVAGVGERVGIVRAAGLLVAHLERLVGSIGAELEIAQGGQERCADQSQRRRRVLRLGHRFRRSHPRRLRLR